MIKRLYYTMVGHRSRATYWAHSDPVKKVRKWLGAEVAPSAATAREWKEFHQRNDGTFVNWLTDDLVDHIQDIMFFPYDVYRNVRIKLINRFVDKPWCLDTGLDKWDWHEMDSRVVHGLFEALVRFVEHEKASMQYWADSRQADKKVKREYPSREKGLAYLDWEISLGEESPLQAENARETKELYLWWKDVRSNRPDPMDESGWSEYCDKRREGCDDNDFWGMLDHEDDTEEQKAESMKLIDRSHEIEQQHYEEDTEMLIRLIKIRRELWT